MKNKSIESAILTPEQKSCVNFNHGDLLIKGVAGSGKSYVILKRALKIYKEKKENESVAIFTFTNSLVKYTHDLLSQKLGSDEIDVFNVDSYCMGVYYRVIGKKFFVGDPATYTRLVKESLIEHKRIHKLEHRFYAMDTSFFEEEFRWIREKCIKTKADYISADRKGRGSQVRLSASDKEIAWSIFSQYVTKARREKYNDWADLYMILNDNLYRIPQDKKIDYVLIDEAQDLTVGMLKVLKALTNKSLTIAADVAQKIYKTSFTWKEVGIEISGRSSKALLKSFRSTKQIVRLAEDLMDKNRSKALEEYTTAVLPEIEGEKPVLVRCNSLLEENTYLINLIKGYSYNDEVIGIVCRTHQDLKSVMNLLYRNNIQYQFIGKKMNDEARWSLLKPGIKVVTAHSSKGLEFERVIIPYLDDSVYPFKTFNIDEEQLEEYLETERNLLYVAMTRARSTLTMLCLDLSSSRFIDEFNTDHYEMVKL
jgi:superfamily I DNA/RNA helicase